MLFKFLLIFNKEEAEILVGADTIVKMLRKVHDLGPRIVHFLLPIPAKRNSDWKYSWVPVLGPMLGATMAAVMYVIFGGV